MTLSCACCLLLSRRCVARPTRRLSEVLCVTRRLCQRRHDASGRARCSGSQRGNGHERSAAAEPHWQVVAGHPPLRQLPMVRCRCSMPHAPSRFTPASQHGSNEDARLTQRSLNPWRGAFARRSCSPRPPVMHQCRKLRRSVSRVSAAECRRAIELHSGPTLRGASVPRCLQATSIRCAWAAAVHLGPQAAVVALRPMPAGTRLSAKLGDKRVVSTQGRSRLHGGGSIAIPAQEGPAAKAVSRG